MLCRAGTHGNGVLEHLNLNDNSVGDDGIHALASGLATNRGLRTLNVTANHVGDEGARHLASALAKNAVLHTLLARHNNIGDAGAAKLAKGVEASGSLVVLFLGGNSVGDAGAKAFASMLKKRTNDEAEKRLARGASWKDGDDDFTYTGLEKLDLSSCKIGAAGAAALTRALAANTTLVELTIYENDVPDVERGALLSLSLGTTVGALLPVSRAPSTARATVVMGSRTVCFDARRPGCMASTQSQLSTAGARIFVEPTPSTAVWVYDCD